MKSFKNKYFPLAFCIMIIILVYLFFFFIKKGLHEPSIIDTPVEKDVNTFMGKPPSTDLHKENVKTGKRFILNLDDLDVIKNAEQKPEKENTLGILQGTMQENAVKDAYGKKDGGTTIYKEGRIKIKGKAGFSEFPEKDDSLDDLIDKSRINGNIGVEF